MAKNIQHKKIQELILRIVGDSLHSKQILSLSNAVQGIICAASLALSVIGKALAELQDLSPKHATKQVDRLFSNSKINLVLFFSNWVSFLVQARTQIVVSLDWTKFDKDGHSTLVLNLITNHGRATPLIWKTYNNCELKGRQGEYERNLLSFFKNILPVSCVKVIILADRGFGDVDLYKFICTTLKFDFIIRFRGNINMTVNGVTKTAKEWLLNKAKLYKSVGLTLINYVVPSVVCVYDKKMKDAWYLASSISSINTGYTARTIINFYGRRFSCEENFRDIKDIRFGMGLSSVSIKSVERRDRIILASAIAVSLVTLLGAAGEAIGLDRLLKVNTAKKRTHSLFTQGCFYFKAMVNYKIEMFEKIMKKYTEILNNHAVFCGLFSFI